jgi:hypothetical protein
MTGKFGTGGRGWILGNRTMQLWNKPPMNALGNFPFKPSTSKKRVKKVKCS